MHDLFYTTKLKYILSALFFFSVKHVSVSPHFICINVKIEIHKIVTVLCFIFVKKKQTGQHEFLYYSLALF